MAQKLVQQQTQKLVQQQKLTQQQVMLIRMLEMPLTELEQSVQTEIDDNPALEPAPGDSDGDYRLAADETDGNGDAGADDKTAQGENDSFEERTEREERESALDDALQRIGGDDDMPEVRSVGMDYMNNGADYEEMTWGDPVSFYDRLKEQMGEQELSDKQQEILEYLIGSLDSDGLLRKDLDTIADELAIYHNIDAEKAEIEEVLAVLQDFDPAGIGARSLQECLLLQMDRKRWTEVRGAARDVLQDHYDDFINKRWGRIAQQMGLSEHYMGEVQAELLKLNPKPGASLGETEGRNIQQITPDFIVDTADDGTVTFTVSNGRVPELLVSESFVDLIAQFKKREERGEKRENLTRSEKEALVYAKEKVERAQGFIEAVKQRRHTLYVTMKAIIDIQRKYFQDGDESDLRPMILKDVADRTGLDISTISRVSNMKYAQTRWGTFKLRHFFSDGYRTENGEELSTRKIKAALQEVVDGEDKRHPLNDDALKEALTKRGFPIARRTISKYREQLGIPVARLRKE